ncbi:hypothetical protein G6F50_015003 [Rhizopus delemar]|uniref:Uncharacterized protein n=1 Tax=Rhizopus delemar TaxID=936053 RepID=A0A9P6Y0R6_9FUNG|nr:hypothetical protein G6F50_015003 [Rhizopus delemar]
MRTFVEEVRRADCTVLDAPTRASAGPSGHASTQKPPVAVNPHGAINRPAARSSATSGSGAIAGPSPATAASSRPALPAVVSWGAARFPAAVPRVEHAAGVAPRGGRGPPPRRPVPAPVRVPASRVAKALAPAAGPHPAPPAPR